MSQQTQLDGAIADIVSKIEWASQQMGPTLHIAGRNIDKAQYLKQLIEIYDALKESRRKSDEPFMGIIRGFQSR